MSEIIGREPPHSSEVEEHVLSCCLLDGGDTIKKCLDFKVPAKAFYFPPNQVIYSALVSIFAGNIIPTIEVLIQELQASKNLDSVGGVPYLVRVSSRVPSTAQSVYFINRMLELHALRELIKINASVLEQCYDYSGGGVGSLIESATSEILAIQSSQSKGVQWGDAVKTAHDETKKLFEGNEPLVSELPWGFQDLDTYFGKPQTGQLVVIGARPSVGKSSLARQIAIANASHGNGVLFMTIEVKSKRLALSMAQTLSRVSYKEIQQRKCSNGDVQAFLRAINEVQEMSSLHVFEDTNVTVATISAKIRALKLKCPIKAVIIDQLNLMDDAVGNNNLRLVEAIARVTRGLKKLACQEDVCIFLLSQLNRAPAGENSEPSLHHLRDSGMIEADADKVVLLHRPSKNPLDDQMQDECSRVTDCPSFYINAIQAKGRDDGTSRVGLSFKRSIATFYQIARSVTKQQENA